MKKVLNQKLINLIEYYNLLNIDLLISDKPIKRKQNNDLFSGFGKKERLEKLKKK